MHNLLIFYSICSTEIERAIESGQYLKVIFQVFVGISSVSHLFFSFILRNIT